VFGLGLKNKSVIDNCAYTQGITWVKSVDFNMCKESSGAYQNCREWNFSDWLKATSLSLKMRIGKRS
jgi:hypothetical protein